MRLIIIAALSILQALMPSYSYGEDPFLRRERELLASDSKKEKADRAGKQQEAVVSEWRGQNEDDKQDADNEYSGPFPGYGAYRELLVDYCKYLISDGHASRIQDILDKLLIEKAECSPCRQLYRAISCKLSSRQPSAQQTYRAREPSTETLAALSGVFGDIGSNPALAGVTAENMKPIIDTLSQPVDAVTDSYFDIFLSYIKTPLRDQLERAVSIENKKKKKAEQKMLEDLF